MKLSEAIRLSGKPQGRGPDSIVSLDAPCALGGVLQSVGIQTKIEYEAFEAIRENWPFTRQPAECPSGDKHIGEILHGTWIEKSLFQIDTRDSVLGIIVFLNDRRRWTRNQIADWVETVEPAEEVQQEAALPSWLTKKARPE